jgi:hypothetical protein
MKLVVSTVRCQQLPVLLWMCGRRSAGEIAVHPRSLLTDLVNVRNPWSPRTYLEALRE